MQIQHALARTRPDADSALRASLRSSLRLTRVSMFLAETVTRHVLDGISQSPHECARELAWLGENLSALSGVRPHVTGPIPQEPCVIVANHISYLDPLVLASLAPCIPIAKSELRDWPVLGDTARRSNVLFVRRECALSGARVLREAHRALDRGVSVLVFPEGTTTHGRRVLPFKRGAFGLAQLASVPIVPVALQYSDEDAGWVGDDTFLPHFVRTLSRPFTPVNVRFLNAIESERDATAAELAEQARCDIARALVDVPRSTPLRPITRPQLAFA